MSIENNEKTEQEKEEEELKNYFIMDKSLGVQFVAGHLIDKYHIKTVGERTRDIYLYKNGIYVLGTNILRGEIERILKSLISKHHKNEIIEKVKDLTTIDRKDFDVDKSLINFDNGTLDIKTGELLEHDPKYLFFNKISTAYEKNANCPMIKKFFSEVLDKDDIPIIQEWIGYALYRGYFIKKAIIFVGEGDTGKTTLLNLIAKFIGKDNVSGVSLQRITSDKFAAAHFYNKHINICDDLSFKDVSDNGAFKIATGGGSITGEYKFGDQFQFQNYAKLTFACNKIPDVKDPNDAAYFGRWIVVHFRNEVVNPDKFLIDKMTTSEELSGLLNFALEGLGRLLEKQKFSYDKDPHEIKKEMQRSGSVIAQFAHDCLGEATGKWISKVSIYETFVQYARSRNLPVGTIENFGKKIRNYADYMIDGKRLEVSIQTKNKVQITGWRNVAVKIDTESIILVEPLEDEPSTTSSSEDYQQEEEQQTLIS